MSDDRLETTMADARSLADAQFISSLKAKNGGRVVLMTTVLWLQLLGAWGIALRAPLPYSLISFVVICACVQAMLNWVHEASHYSLFTSRRRNDVWTNLFFAGPIGMNVATYRRAHMTHHAYLSTPNDMDRTAFDIDIHGWNLPRVIVRVLSGYDGIRLVLTKYAKGLVPGSAREKSHIPQSRQALSIVTGWNGLLLGVCVLSGRWYLYGLLWVFPIICVSVLLNVFRSIAEHQPHGYPGDQPAEDKWMMPLARTTLPGPVEKWLIYQANFNYHLEHHLFPLIPAHNLPKLHAHLRERGLYDRHPDCLQASGIGRVITLSREATASIVPVEA